MEERLDISTFPFSGQISLTEGFRFVNTVITTSSRQEQVINRRESPLLSANLGGMLFTGDCLDELTSLFGRVQGSTKPFRYKSTLEYNATSDKFYPCPDDENVYHQGVVVATEPVTQTMYLAKRYTFYTESSLVFINSPIPGTATLYRIETIDNVETKNAVSISTYSINYDTGEISFIDPTIVDGLVADFEYDTIVRFESNTLPGITEVAPVTIDKLSFTPERLYSVSSLSLTEEVVGSPPAAIYTPAPYNAFRLNVYFVRALNDEVLSLLNVGTGFLGLSPFYTPLIGVEPFCRTVIRQGTDLRSWSTGIDVICRDSPNAQAVTRIRLLTAAPAGGSPPGTPFYDSYCSIEHLAEIPGFVYTIVRVEVIPV
jgi:uncharacterized protein (TIGR02217 family)